MDRPKPRIVIAPPDVSRCVLLKNCFNPAEESGTSWVKELEDDVKMECENKYGKVSPPSLELNSMRRSITSMLNKIRMAKSISNSTVSVPEKRPFKD